MRECGDYLETPLPSLTKLAKWRRPIDSFFILGIHASSCALITQTFLLSYFMHCTPFLDQWALLKSPINHPFFFSSFLLSLSLLLFFIVPFCFFFFIFLNTFFVLFSLFFLFSFLLFFYFFFIFLLLFLGSNRTELGSNILKIEYSTSWFF